MIKLLRIFLNIVLLRQFLIDLIVYISIGHSLLIVSSSHAMAVCYCLFHNPDLCKMTSRTPTIFKCLDNAFNFFPFTSILSTYSLTSKINVFNLSVSIVFFQALLKSCFSFPKIASCYLRYFGFIRKNILANQIIYPSLKSLSY